MAEKTGIAWTHHSWSPWIGCTEVSPGCDACYARELDKRHRYGGAVHWGTGVPRYRTKSWNLPIAWNKKAQVAGERRTIFPSLCDPFDNEVPREWRDDLWTLIYETPHLTWLLLTKRIGNAAKMIPPSPTDDDADYWQNVWLGASVVNQEEADRDIPKLLATPAAKRFVSYEPALAAVDFRPYLKITRGYAMTQETNDGELARLEHNRPALDWLIVGGESAQGGAQARTFDLAWARQTVQQCKAANVACFFKQAGSNPLLNSRPLKLRDRAGADISELPTDLQIQEFPS